MLGRASVCDIAWVRVVRDDGSWYDVLESTRSYLANVFAFFNMPPRSKAPSVSGTTVVCRCSEVASATNSCYITAGYSNNIIVRRMSYMLCAIASLYLR